MLQAIGRYSTIGGGYGNFAKGDYATIAGGQQNTVLSNYGTILGGYSNKVSGRFGTVVGGSKNTASGRHSAAIGYYAVDKGDYSMTACFTGEQCTNDQANTIAFFADAMYINDVSIDDLIASRARLLGEDDAVDTLSKAQNLAVEYSTNFDEIKAELEAAIAQQDALFNTIADKLQ